MKGINRINEILIGKGPSVGERPAEGTFELRPREKEWPLEELEERQSRQRCTETQGWKALEHQGEKPWRGSSEENDSGGVRGRHSLGC